MGRQIHFYMVGTDLEQFLQAAQSGGTVGVTLRDSDSAEILPADKTEFTSGKTLCLWNRILLQDLDRKWIREPEPGYFRVDSLKEPVLELKPSFSANWEHKPALGQGRLFGNFEAYLSKPKEFEEWYEKLASWIRRHFRKGPSSMGGFVGPAAYQVYQDGGYLLPNYLPPRTDEWLAEIKKQHTVSRTV